MRLEVVLMAYLVLAFSFLTFFVAVWIKSRRDDRRRKGGDAYVRGADAAVRKAANSKLEVSV